MEGKFVNGIPVVRSLSYKPKGAIEKVVHPIFVEQDGTLYLLQHVGTSGSDYPFYYYVDLGTAVKEFMFHTANVEPGEKDKDCRDCKFSEVREDEEPCVSCWDHNFFEFREPEPKATQDTVNLKMRDTNGDWHEMEVPVKEKTCPRDECIHPYADLEQCTECHNESEPLTFANVKVGDELEDIIESPVYVPTVIVVTYNWSGCIYALKKRTGTYEQLSGRDLSHWRKTGKTYPEIAKLIGGKE